MRVIYLLRGTALYGGVKVPLQHVRALRQLGFDARAVGPEAPADWFPDMGRFYRKVAVLEPSAIGRADVVVAAHWSLVGVARAIPAAEPVHFCQGYEGLYEFFRPEWPTIEAVYRLPVAKMAVSPHLVDLLRETFHQEAEWIPQPLVHDPQPEPPRPPDGGFRVLVAGQWADPAKGVPWALAALEPLRHELPPLRLVRLTQHVPPEELAAWADAERHVHVGTTRVSSIMRSVDLVVAPSHEAEGFGLPVLEAFDAGRPAVTTDIPAFRALDPNCRASRRVPYRDAAALVHAVRELRDDVELRRRLGMEGRSIAGHFSEERTGQSLRRFFERIVLARSGEDRARKLQPRREQREAQ